MKYLFLLLLVSCNYSDIKLVEERDLKFHAGEYVRIISGFYKNCDGFITDHSKYYNPSDKLVRYDLNLTCDLTKIKVNGVDENNIERQK